MSSFYVRRHEFPAALVLPASVHAAAAVDAAKLWPYNFALETEVSRQWLNYEKQRRAAEELEKQAEASRIAEEKAAEAARVAEAKAEADRVAKAKAAEAARIMLEQEEAQRREAENAAAIRAAEEAAERQRAENLSQMHSMTSADEDTCRRLLAANGGNVQEAIQAFYNEEEAVAKRTSRAEAEAQRIAAEKRARLAEDRRRQGVADRLLAERLMRQGSAALDEDRAPSPPPNNTVTPPPLAGSGECTHTGIQPVHNPFGVSNPFVDANPFTDSPTSRDVPPPSYPQPPSYGVAAGVPPPSYGGNRPPRQQATVGSFPDEHRSKVEQLISLTQKSEAACRHMLMKFNYDVARATDAFFNGEYTD